MSKVQELPSERALSDLISPKAFIAHDEAVKALEEKKRAFLSPDDIDIDNATDEQLRYLLKHVLKTQREQAAQAVQPLGVDQFSGLPVHFEPPECPVCRPFFAQRTIDGRDRYVCHDCVQPIPDIETQEFGATGLQSTSVTHMHMHIVMGGRGEQIRIPGRRLLCVACFRLDYEKTTGKPCDL